MTTERLTCQQCGAQLMNEQDRSRHMSEEHPTTDDEALEDDDAMIDSYAYGPLVLLVDHPERFVIASDRDFEQRLRDAHHQVDYIMLAPPVGQASLTGANAFYPEMYGGGIPWARLVTEYTENGNGRLFRIDRNVPN